MENKFKYKVKEYKNFRLYYPDLLFQFLKTSCGPNNIVLECGCGSGQATLSLSKFFDQVIAIDLSHELLADAEKNPKVQFIQGSCETLPITDKSIDLVCVAQAAHWFQPDLFYGEISRILKPTGKIAVWCYNRAKITPEIDLLIEKIYTKINSKENFSRERQFVADDYTTLPFPFKKIKAPKFEIKNELNLYQLLGYLRTWPGVLSYNEKHQRNLISEVENEFLDYWNSEPEKRKTINWPIHLLLGEVSD